MITKAPSFVTSDQQTFLTLEAAQGHEITLLLRASSDALKPDGFGQWIMENKEKLIDVLTTTPTSKTRARKVNGGTKMRKTAKAAMEVYAPKLPTT